MCLCMINHFRDDFAFLSNFHPSPIYFQGICYATVEHAFQASKSNKLEDKYFIASAQSPGIAKRRGKKVTLRDNWEQDKVRVMLELIYLKFTIPEFHTMLLETGEEELIEGNYWHDQFWGSCYCHGHKDTPGLNYLGRCIMAVREFSYAD